MLSKALGLQEQTLRLHSVMVRSDFLHARANPFLSLAALCQSKLHFVINVALQLLLSPRTVSFQQQEAVVLNIMHHSDCCQDGIATWSVSEAFRLIDCHGVSMLAVMLYVFASSAQEWPVPLADNYSCLFCEMHLLHSPLNLALHALVQGVIALGPDWACLWVSGL